MLETSSSLIHISNLQDKSRDNKHADDRDDGNDDDCSDDDDDDDDDYDDGRVSDFADLASGCV